MTRPHPHRLYRELTARKWPPRHSSRHLSRSKQFLHAWKTLARFGLMGLSFPKKYSGIPCHYREVVGILALVGKKFPFAGIPLSLGAQMWGVQTAILEFGTEWQKKKFLRPLCGGTAIAALAMTEEAAGSDIMQMRSEAQRIGRGYRLTGNKIRVTNAPIASFFLVWARLKNRSGPFALSCFLVPKTAKGLRVFQTRRGETALANSVMGSLAMNTCEVPLSFRLGLEGQGFPIFHQSMKMERSLILAPIVGSMERLLEEAVEYAKTRKQFGRPISDFQAISHKLADMKIRLECSRSLLGRASDDLSRGRHDEIAPIVKTHISEAWVLSCMDAIAIQGARGCVARKDLQDELMAALACRTLSGTNEIQKNIIAARLLRSERETASSSKKTAG